MFDIYFLSFVSLYILRFVYLSCIWEVYTHTSMNMCGCSLLYICSSVLVDVRGKPSNTWVPGTELISSILVTSVVTH